jgi:RHS repeat-associated protein
MPGRKFTSGTDYRYGFNGKEKDDEVKGEGNQQDYGMRIYDPRLGRFLSVDPIANSYPWYTPYQFAGNDVMRCIDLDGGEPTIRTEKYNDNYKPFIGGGWYIDVYDKTKNQIFQASGIYDPNIGRTYIIADDGQGQNKYFYLVNDNGAADKIQWKIENGRNVLVGGKFVQYETRNEIDTRITNELCVATEIVVLGAATTIAATEAGVGIGTLYNGKRAIDKLNEKETPKEETPTAKENVKNRENEIPDVAKDVEKFIKDHNGSAPKGYKGGRKFENDGRDGGEVLRQNTSDGTPINYKEYDINPYKKDVGRGAERIVRGSDGKSYYTPDHYKTFTEIKEP